jgi:hypothetical protein
MTHFMLVFGGITLAMLRCFAACPNYEGDSMNSEESEFNCPGFRQGVSVDLRAAEATISLAARQCSFEFPEEVRPAVVQLLKDLDIGGYTPSDLKNRAPEIAGHIPALIADFSQLRLLTESEPNASTHAISGSQLYRELRRVAHRVTSRAARSAFYRALVEDRAQVRQIIGYGLEYYWLVRSAPGLIAPALASAHCPAERRLLEGFLASEIGHDKFIGAALQAAGVAPESLDRHQPLAATFALGASLGVYARQHPISFKACLFILEEARPEFIDAFDRRCESLGLPPSFYLPLREHADLNAEYDHGDISADLLAFEGAVDTETCTVVKRHLALLIETIVQQEEQILDYYGRSDTPMPRIFT